MTGSIALMVVLFLTFSACLDLVHKLLPSVSDFTPDITVACEDNANAIGLDLPEKISEIPGVETAFGIMDCTACPVEINGRGGRVDLFSYADAMLDRYAGSVVSGSMERVYGDTGYALAVYNQENRLNVGDTVNIGGEELEIACVVSEGVGSISGAVTVACSEETFVRVTGVQGYSMVSVLLNGGASEDTVKQVRALAEGYVFLDNREANRDTYGSYWVFRIAAYGFLAIISLIAVLNMVNSMSMSVSARVRQYGAMRAVGMEDRQLTRMIAAEAASYAACGTAVGLVLGLLLHYLIYAAVITTHFGGSWSIPAAPVAVVLLMIFTSCALAVHVPAKRIRGTAVTDTINEL